MNLAQKIAAWLTPVRRQALYVIVTTLATLVIATSPIQSTQVAIWLQLVIAVGIVGSQVLGSIVTKSVPWKAVYRVLGILVAAITAAGWLSGSHADLVMRILEQFGAIVPMIAILLRTDTSTADGSPASPAIEVATAPAVAVPAAAEPDVTPAAAAPPTASTLAIGGKTVYDPNNGTPPTIISN
jgi:hypothetical protein